MMTPPTRILLVLIGTALWLGLAVAGFGGVAAFFANPARTALAVVLVALFRPLAHLPPLCHKHGIYTVRP